MDINQLDESHGRPAIQFSCAKCGTTVTICQSCWRNQKYCSDECCHAATVLRHRRNQKAYRMTETGRDHNIAHQRAYRARKKIASAQE